MICHKRKIIFIHIPKTAGSSINKYLADSVVLDWKKPNYEVLYGWCPDRKIHLQHATSKQLLETELVTEDQWRTYFKFTFIRNPWDRAYSDYLWIVKDTGVRGSFENYIKKEGPFKKVLSDNSEMSYRGDHLTVQSDFFIASGKQKIDFIGKFEKFNNDIEKIKKQLNLNKEFNFHEKKNHYRFNHYSLFYTNSKKNLVDDIYKKDIEELGYSFEDRKKGIFKLKNIF